MKKEYIEYTISEERLLEIITQAFYDGFEAGGTDYGDEKFSAKDYLPESL